MRCGQLHVIVEPLFASKADLLCTGDRIVYEIRRVRNQDNTGEFSKQVRRFSHHTVLEY